MRTFEIDVSLVGVYQTCVFAKSWAKIHQELIREIYEKRIIVKIDEFVFRSAIKLQNPRMSWKRHKQLKDDVEKHFRQHEISDFWEGIRQCDNENDGYERPSEICFVNRSVSI